MDANPVRRKLLKTAGLGLALFPLVALPRQAWANTNGEVRARLHYQATPQGDKRCATCLEFLPGLSDSAPGGCKQIPEDDEISPNGYCTLWNSL